ncbi:hypothetical protein KJ359_010116 [Pestalotiopsis sp. 9143b]|nr:hypothetical protein KJ359_010116 [Pestalotiopsis sp. 9143b]
MNLLQGDSHLVAIDDSAPSFPLPTLALVISSGKYQIKKWDTLSSQVVAMETLMTTADLERERSWVLKSGESVDRFYTLLTDQQVHHLEETGDHWCPAWNEDIMWTALSLLEEVEGFLGIPNIEYNEEVQATKLSDDEVLLVEEQLVLCYMTRVMTIQSRRDGTMYDAISGHPLTYRKGELMNVEAFKIDQLFLE